jgi:predicted GTPase
MTGLAVPGTIDCIGIRPKIRIGLGVDQAACHRSARNVEHRQITSVIVAMAEGWVPPTTFSPSMVRANETAPIDR